MLIIGLKTENGQLYYIAYKTHYYMVLNESIVIDYSVAVTVDLRYV